MWQFKEIVDKSEDKITKEFVVRALFFNENEERCEHFYFKNEKSANDDEINKTILNILEIRNPLVEPEPEVKPEEDKAEEIKDNNELILEIAKKIIEQDIKLEEFVDFIKKVKKDEKGEITISDKIDVKPVEPIDIEPVKPDKTR